MAKEAPNFRTLTRILEIIEILSKHPDGLTMTNILTELGGPPKSSIYTLLQQMTKKHMLYFEKKDKIYKIGPALIRLSALTMANYTIQKQVRPFLNSLSKVTGEDTYLGILSGNHTLYIDKVEGTESVRLKISVGHMRYPHSSSIGKLLLAFLPEDELNRIIAENGLPSISPKTITNKEKLQMELQTIREEGVSIANEETFIGVVGIAAPIKNKNNVVIAGIGISLPISRFEQNRDSLIQKVRKSAQEVSEMLYLNEH